MYFFAFFFSAYIFKKIPNSFELSRVNFSPTSIPSNSKMMNLNVLLWPFLEVTAVSVCQKLAPIVLPVSRRIAIQYFLQWLHHNMMSREEEEWNGEPLMHWVHHHPMLDALVLVIAPNLFRTHHVLVSSRKLEQWRCLLDAKSLLSHTVTWYNGSNLVIFWYVSMHLQRKMLFDSTVFGLIKAWV